MVSNAQVYKGSDEILLSKLVLDPAHSILKQSFDSRLRLVSTTRASIAPTKDFNLHTSNRTLDVVKTTPTGSALASTPTPS